MDPQKWNVYKIWSSNVSIKGYKIKLCYEASYVGYCLQRDLISKGIHCDIVSPSSIPSPRGKAIKTDRIDAGYLAQFYANDLLTIVQPPDEEQEQSFWGQSQVPEWVSVDSGT